VNKILSAIGVLLLSGCALLNPYESSFSCPETATGKCVSVQTAYKESTATVAGKPAEAAPERKDEECKGENADSACLERRKDFARSTPSPENRYRAALFDKYSGLLKEPVTPVVAPPKTMRVLILPYTGQDNELNMLRYVYFFVDEPRWLLGDAVMSDEEE